MAITFQLENGLRVVAQPRDTAKVAAFQVWVNAGSADENPDEVGLAHLHEHLLFKGTARRGPGEIARSVEAHGGEINAWTSYDQTVYHVVMASRFAREGLDVLADAVRNSAFDPTELTREIEVVCEEIKRSLDTPSRRASKELFAAAYTQHPYGRPVIGFEADVRSHTRERMLGFYRRHYTPKNIALAAVGDFTEGQLRDWAQELFGGDWGRPAVAPPPRAKEPRRTDQQVKLLKEDVKEAYLHLAFPCPAVDHEDVPALDVLAMVLGQGDSSRLSVEVKRRRALCNDASTWAYTPKDPGLFALSLTTSSQTCGAAFEVARPWILGEDAKRCLRITRSALLSGIFAYLTAQYLNQMFARPRPFLSHPVSLLYIAPNDPSFPSRRRRPSAPSIGNAVDGASPER